MRTKICWKYFKGQLYNYRNKESYRLNSLSNFWICVSIHLPGRKFLFRICEAPMKIFKNIALLMCMAGLFSANAGAQESDLTFSTIIHSRAFDKNMKLVVLDEKNIPQQQDILIQKLRSRLDGDTLKQYDAIAKDLMARAGDDRGRQNWARFILIAGLNEKFKMPESSKTALLNIRLASRLSSLLKDPITAQMFFKHDYPGWIGRLDPAIDFQINPDVLGHLFPGYAYTHDCANNGVPIPPPIKLNADNNLSDTAANGWQIATRDAAQLMADNLPASMAQQQIHSYLEPSQQPGLANKISKMYYWYPKITAKNQGVCIANPIIDDPAAAEPRVTALGIICQSLAPKKIFFPSPKFGRPYKSHACFWDNNGSLDSTVSHSFTDGSFLAPPEPLNATPNALLNLPDDNRCTECHAGDNAFVVMSGDMNDLALQKFDTAHPASNIHDHSNWFVPLVQADWPQNTFRSYPAGLATNPNDPSNCGSCHKANYAGRLPQVQGVNPRDNLYKFCWFMLPNFLTKDVAMGFDTPGLMSTKWSNASPSGADGLYTACQALFPGNTYPQPVANSAFPTTKDLWLKPNVQ
jgi:hypothetical protein